MTPEISLERLKFLFECFQLASETSGYSANVDAVRWALEEIDNLTRENIRLKAEVGRLKTSQIWTEASLIPGNNQTIVP